MLNLKNMPHLVVPQFKFYSQFRIQKALLSNTIDVQKTNISQSPWKMNFLVKLVRGAWVPDALAQMKFSPKHRAEDIRKMIQRASVLAKIRHDAVPEELLVKEVSVTKGQSHKRMRIMGRGRTGFGYARWSHVNMTLEQIDFKAEIEKAKSLNQKNVWMKRYELVKKAKSIPPPPPTSTNSENI
eukprot:gene1036-2029_t